MIDEMYCFSLAANLNDGKSIDSRYDQRDARSLTSESFDHRIDCDGNCPRTAVDERNERANRPRFPLSSCKLAVSRNGIGLKSQFDCCTREPTWIVLPLRPKVIEGDVNVHVLKIPVSNRIGVRFEFFDDKLEHRSFIFHGAAMDNRGNVPRYSPMILRVHLCHRPFVHEWPEWPDDPVALYRDPYTG